MDKRIWVDRTRGIRRLAGQSIDRGSDLTGAPELYPGEVASVPYIYRLQHHCVPHQRFHEWIPAVDHEIRLHMVDCGFRRHLDHGASLCFPELLFGKVRLHGLH